jgi:hypothetical protein
MILQAALIDAAERFLGPTPKGPRKKGDLIVVMSRVANMQFGLPIYGALENALSSKPPEAFGFSFCPGVPPQGTMSSIAEFPGYLDQMIGALFVLHFETCRDWLEANNYNDTTAWPMRIDFARTVRNAVSHAGQLEIRKTKRGNVYRTVTWHGLSYSIADHGRQILGSDLYGPDLVALMLDVDDELVVLGAPK